MGERKVIELAVEIGHKSKPLAKKLPNGYTHKWTAFVRGHKNSKPEHCITRVVFQLHDSFPNPERVVTTAPFQIKETGYAGFEIPIQIYFRNKDKPHHLVYVHDLVLLNDRPSENSTIERLKFVDPNKDFERRLLKSGAQVLPSLDKKERSNSPPAKKRKSATIIPSKDMSHQPTTKTNSRMQPSQPTSHQTPKQHHHKSQSHHNQTLGANSNHQSSRQPHPHQPTQKPKPSKDFIDVFGPPLVYNSHKQNSKEEQRDDQQGSNDLHSLQMKISCLSDSDRLQKIVDIIEEAGEWFNLTPKKFEFDLKRLDKKTLSKIERCLQH